MDSLEFARKTALLGVLAAIAWAGFFLYFQMDTRDLVTTQMILDEGDRFMQPYQVLFGLHLLLVALHLPVLVSLRTNLRKQDETFSLLGLGLGLGYIAFAALTDLTQIQVVSRAAARHLFEMKNVFPVPPPTEFEIFYHGRIGSFGFASGLLAHLFLAAAMVLFAWMLFPRARALAWPMLLVAGTVVVTYGGLTRGIKLAVFGFFALGLFQAAVLYQIAKRYRRLLEQRH